jgi:hypothetical protein
MGRSSEGTHVEYLILADSVEVIDGKLNVSGGGWDSFSVPDIWRPVRVPFACGVQVPWAEADKEHTLTLSVETADGKPIASPSTQTFRTGRPPTLGPGAVARVPFAMRWDLTFPAHGRYAVVAAVDSRRDGGRRVEFSVRAAPQGESVISEEEMNIIDEEMAADLGLSAGSQTSRT